MASIATTRISLSPSSSNSNPKANPKFASRTSAFLSHSPRPTVRPLKKHHHHHQFNSTPCQCKKHNSSGESGGIRWNMLLQDALHGAVKRCKEYLSSYWDSFCKEVEEELEELSTEELESEEKVFPKGEEKKERLEWSWERWKQHFGETHENERLLQALKLQLRSAVAIEDFNSAARLKQAIYIARKYDFVGKAISDLNRAIEEERYADAADIRDRAGAGLIGWWAGLSENVSDPHGLIVRITAEYGRYVAKSYSSRQLTSSSPDFPLFEVYFTKKNGELKQQAVYMKPGNINSSEFDNVALQKSDISDMLMRLSDSLSGGQGPDIDDPEVDQEEKDSLDNPSILNLSQDNTFPRFKFKILKVTSTGKIDRDQIAKIIDQILEEDDTDEDDNEENDDDGFEVSELENLAEEETETDAAEEVVYNSKNSRSASEKVPDSLVHIPARLERKDRFAFTLYIDNDEKPTEDSGTQQLKKKKAAVISLQHGADLMLPDLSKLGSSKKKVSVKIVIPDRKLSRNKISHQLLSGATHFRRIMTPVTSDPLSGLYVAASGMDSEILCLQRKFGQWKEDDATANNERDLEFYEYVEAIKLTGDHLVPAGQVMFRAKIGKRHQLPHKGLIPKELGVVARYKGQGRISGADIGFKNLHWVDGELLILDGKFIRDGPVIGFFYWASNFHVFEFFSRLNLPD